MDGTYLNAVARIIAILIIQMGLSNLALAHEEFMPQASCAKASRQQLRQVNAGNKKEESFTKACSVQTQKSPWCEQLKRPNPASINTFKCTYGNNQPHQLIHPDEKTWLNGYQAINLIEELQSLGVQVCQIYNWWRPEPYNKNVGGSATRHPFGTSIDVRFCSLGDMELAFTQLCEWRSKGRLKALGYYGTTGLHFGISDSNGNTWGKVCPT